MISIRDSEGRGYINVDHINGSRWDVYNVYVSPQHRGKGVGHAMLKEICRQADEEGVTLQLTVAADGDGLLSDEGLFAWYGRHGFERTAISYNMRRYPRQVTTGTTATITIGEHVGL